MYVSTVAPCEPECPNNAIYEGGTAWSWSEGTKLKQVTIDGSTTDASTPQKPLSDEAYYIATDK